MTGKIKVFHLVNSYEIGGAEKLLYYFIKNSSFDRFTSIVGALSMKGPLKEDFEAIGISAFDFNLQPGLDLTVVPKICRVLKNTKTDILHTHNLGPHFYGSIAALLVRVKCKIHTEHGISGKHRHESLLKHRYLDRKSDYVVAVSPQVEEFLRKRWKPRCHLATVINGIEIQGENHQSRNVSLLRKEMGVGKGDQIIGHVGRLSEIKNQSMLLQAFRLLYDKFPSCRLVIVGDGPLRYQLLNEAKSLKIDDRVHFMGERNDVKDFLSIFDVFALPSFSEGISIALLEAMVQGAVPIVTDVGGNSVVIKNDLNGILSPSGDQEQFARNIELILGDSKLKSRLRKNAIDTVNSNFSIQKMVRDYQAIYVKSLKGGWEV